MSPAWAAILYAMQPALTSSRLRQADVFLRRHVAQHRRAGARRFGGADGAGDVVVAGEDVGHQRTEHVERRVVADPLLQLHVERDLIERHVARSLDHRLHAGIAGAVHELAQRMQLGELRRVGGVGRQPGRRPSPSE